VVGVVSGSPPQYLRRRKGLRAAPVPFYPCSMRFVFIALAALALQASAQQPNPAAAAQPEDLLRQGIDAQQAGDLKQAIESYRKALALRPDFGQARANLGAALSADGQFDAAIEEDKRALETVPDKTSVRLNLALAYYKKGDCENAAPEFKAVHDARPGLLTAAMLLGYCDVKLGRAGEAAEMLQPQEQANRGNPDFEYVLAYALIESGREADGMPRMEKVAAATHSVDGWVIAGEARLHRREFNVARTDLDTAMALNPDFPGLATLAGQARDAMGDTKAAQPAFEAALRQNPKDFMANLYLGTMHVNQRQFDQARPLLEEALALQPEMEQARFQMAKLNSMTGKEAEAAATLEELEKADPNWIDPHIELAALYYKLHRPEDGQRERGIVQQLEAKKQQAGPPRAQ
jgi:tetratricopeptide (TPR) repeat protein